MADRRETGIGKSTLEGLRRAAKVAFGLLTPQFREDVVIPQQPLIDDRNAFNADPSMFPVEIWGPSH